MRIDGAKVPELASVEVARGRESTSVELGPAVHNRARECTGADAVVVHRLIRALAEESEGVKKVEISVEDLECDLTEASASAALVEILADGVSWRAVGFVLFYGSYSSWTGKALYLEDVFVEEEMRGLGLGLMLLNYCAERSVKASFERMQCKLALLLSSDSSQLWGAY